MKRIQSHFHYWTVRYQALVMVLAGVLTQLQDYVPDIKTVLTGKYLLAFIVFNAVVTYWLRVRNTGRTPQ